MEAVCVGLTFFSTPRFYLLPAVMVIMISANTSSAQALIIAGIFSRCQVFPRCTIRKRCLESTRGALGHPYVYSAHLLVPLIDLLALYCSLRSCALLR